MKPTSRMPARRECPELLLSLLSLYVATFFVHLYLFRGSFHYEQCSLFQEYPDHIPTVTHSQLSSTTPVWSAGHWAGPLEQLGLRALLKGTSVVVMREGQSLLFTFPTSNNCKGRARTCFYLSLSLWPPCHLKCPQHQSRDNFPKMRTCSSFICDTVKMFAISSIHI